MKKAYSLFSVLVTTVFCFSSCVKTIDKIFSAIYTRPYYFDYNKMMETVEKIEIIDIKPNAPEDRSLSYFNKINETHYTILKVVIDKEMNELLFDLSNIEYTAHGDGTWNRNPRGLTLKIYYTNSDYGFINHNTYTRFNKNNEWVSSIRILCSKEIFYGFISNYIEWEIEINDAGSFFDETEIKEP